MLLLSQINIPRDGGETSIQLLQGDLTAIPPEHAVDILAVSAYPNNYAVNDKATLIAALYAKGIVVNDIAKDKEIDLLANLNCWLSKPLSKPQQDEFNFKRILCFEPPSGEAKEKVVANIFRCINMFAYDKQNNIIALPVLASGNQKVPMETMLPAILDAAIFWLESGLPLSCIKLVLRNETQVSNALPLFVKAKEQYELKRSVQQGTLTATEALKIFEHKNQTQVPQASTLLIVENEIKELATKETTNISTLPQAPPQIVPAPAPAQEATRGSEIPVKSTPQHDPLKPYDYFISYSHKQTQQVKIFVDALLQNNPQLNIFYDRTTIPTGGLWIKLISDAIQNANAVVCILSPDYNNSNVCWDEFQCAKAKEYRTKQSIIKTINFFNDANMPLIMSIYSYIDCTEGDIEKLKSSVTELV